MLESESESPKKNPCRVRVESSFPESESESQVWVIMYSSESIYLFKCSWWFGSYQSIFVIVYNAFILLFAALLLFCLFYSHELLWRTFVNFLYERCNINIILIIYILLSRCFAHAVAEYIRARDKTSSSSSPSPIVNLRVGVRVHQCASLSPGLKYSKSVIW